jgi:hypothetical protein
VTATTTTPAPPPWSLAVLAPGLAAYLDEHPADHTARLCAADEVDAAGFPAEAERLRWVARAGRAPRFFSSQSYRPWYWWMAIDRTPSEKAASFTLPADSFDGFSNDGFQCIHNSDTRQAAENALIAYLLKFDTNPFEATT